MTIGTSQVSIVNLALGNFGDDRHIEAFNEKSREAGMARQYYDQARQETLEAFNWNFARNRLALALHGDPAPQGWQYRYQRPVDAISLREIWNPSVHVDLPGFWPGALPFSMAGNAIPYEELLSLDGETLTICTDWPDAEMIYTKDAQNPALFSPLFITAMAYNLAAKLAMPLTQKAALQQQFEQKFNMMVVKAAASQANQERARPPRDADWINGRF